MLAASCAVSACTSLDFERVERAGVPLRLGRGVALASDFLGRPRRLTGDVASASRRGTVVILVRVTFLTVGDIVLSASLSGSA